MFLINSEKLSPVSAGLAGTPGYIDSSEYAMLQDLWQYHAHLVADGWSVGACRRARDMAIAFHHSATLN